MKRILIIDDAATVRMFHRMLLEGQGYQTDEAVNGIEALEKALQDSYDLNLVDINMPKLDGYGFLRELRSRDMPQAPAIIISTEAEMDDQKRAFFAGANAYCVKPCKPDELLPQIRLLLGEALP
jgi:two-component system chemotaxis response regulator CheY